MCTSFIEQREKNFITIMSTGTVMYETITSFQGNLTTEPTEIHPSVRNETMMLTLEELNQIEVHRRLAPMIYLGILIVIGVPGNLTVLFVYLLKFDSSTYRTFIVALALIDLVGSAVCMPFEIIEMNFQYTFYAVGACKFFRFNNTFVALMSIFVLLALSADRYRRVCRPLKPQMSMFMARVLCGVAALLAILFSWPILFLLGTRHVSLPNNVTGYDCSTSDKYKKTFYPLVHAAILFLTFVVSIVSLIVIYSLIGRKIFKHVQFRNTFRTTKSSSISSGKTSSTKLPSEGKETVVLVNVNKVTSSTDARKQSNGTESKKPVAKQNEKSDEQSKNKITKIAFAICLAFILSYLPHLIITVWTAVKGGFIAPPGPIVSAVLPIVTRSIFLNNIVNPFIYGFLDRRFKKIVLSCVCKK